MSKKKWAVVVLILMILSNCLLFLYLPFISQFTTLKVTLTSDQPGEYQVFYSDDGIYSDGQSVTAKYEKADEVQTLEFPVQNMAYFRMDFGSEAATVEVQEISFACAGETMTLGTDALLESTERNDIVSVYEKEEVVILEVGNEDPRLVLNLGNYDVKAFVQETSKVLDTVFRVLACAAIDILLLGFFFVGRSVKTLFRELFQNRRLIMRLAINDFKTKYVGSYLGIMWAFIQPVITVLVYWFVFGVGLKSGPVNGDFPFVLWLIAGLVPWFFFQDALSGGTGALMEYQYLVKKIVFKISMLPVVKLISALFVHLFFIAFTIFLYGCYGYWPDLFDVQLLYYTLCNFVLSLGICYATCSIVIFFRDTTQIINVVLQVGVWMTPIMWNIQIIPERFRGLFNILPMNYIVSGFRDSLIDKVWFWETPYETIYFWFITAVLFGIGTMVFKRLKVHFADVL